LLFEGNWAKDHEDTAKNLTVGYNYVIKFTNKNKLHTKNNTNMLSDSQDKLPMARSWKYDRR